MALQLRNAYNNLISIANKNSNIYWYIRWIVLGIDNNLNYRCEVAITGKDCIMYNSNHPELFPKRLRSFIDFINILNKIDGCFLEVHLVSKVKSPDSKQIAIITNAMDIFAEAWNGDLESRGCQINSFYHNL